MIGCCMLMCIQSFAQSDSLAYKEKKSLLADEWLVKLNGTTSQTQDKLLLATKRSLQKLRMQEDRLLNKVKKKDTLLNNGSLLSTAAFYDGLQKRVSSGMQLPAQAFSDVYSSKLDSLKTAMKFLSRQKLLQSVQGQKQYQQLLSQYNELQQKFNETNDISRLLMERQQQLLDKIGELGRYKGFRKMQEQIAGYRSKISACKEIWENPSKLESKITGLLAGNPDFRTFFNSNSDLGSIFQLGSSQGNAANAANLQTRDALNQIIAQSTGSASNVQSRIQESLPSGAGQVDGMLSDLQKLTDLKKEDPGLTGAHAGFKRRKSFRERLEYSTNIQTVRADNFFPATTDLGLSVGYRFNERSTAGLGSSGKIGWGKGFQDINITGQGLSLRTFTDIKLKGSIWISGGWEFNYQQPFHMLRSLRQVSDWKQSALLGLTKKLNIGSGLFKSYEIKLLYDFLYRYRAPVTTPFKFRVGYCL